MSPQNDDKMCGSSGCLLNTLETQIDNAMKSFERHHVESMQMVEKIFTTQFTNLQNDITELKEDKHGDHENIFARLNSLEKQLVAMPLLFEEIVKKKLDENDTVLWLVRCRDTGRIVFQLVGAAAIIGLFVYSLRIVFHVGMP